MGSLLDSMWALWDISDTSAPLSPLPTSYGISADSFNDITGIGFFFTADATKNRASMEINSFHVSGPAPVPEPGAVALLAFVGAGWVFRSRFSRGSCKH